jgi:uncharacterized protein
MTDHDAQSDRIKDLFTALDVPDPDGTPASRSLARAVASSLPSNGSTLPSAAQADINEALSIYLFQAYYEHQTLGMILVDLDGRLHRVNDAFCGLLGYTADELAGVSFKYLVYPDDRNPAFDRSLQALLTGDPDLARLELRCLRKDGQLVWLELHPALAPDLRVKPAYVTLAAVDVTQGHQLAAEPQAIPTAIDFFQHIDRYLAGHPEPTELMEWTARNLPAAFDQPAICLAAVEYQGSLYGSPQALASLVKISEGLFVGGEQFGWLYVGYTEARPFTEAEATLLGAIASRLQGYLEQVRPADEFGWLDDLLARLDAAEPDEPLLIPTEPPATFDQDYILHKATAAAEASLPGGASPPPLPPSLLTTRKPLVEAVAEHPTAPTSMTTLAEVDLPGPNGSGGIDELPATQPKAGISRAFTAYLVFYLAALALAELVATVINPRSGLLIDGILLVLILLQSSRRATRSEQKFLLTLALAPLIRLLSLSMPLLVFPYTFWYLVVGIPLFLSVFLVYRLIGYKPAEVGLSLGSGLPLQLAVGLTGLVFGYVEYRLLPPQLFTASFSQQNILLSALILLVFTGLLEELIFRGLMQRAALDAIKRLGPLYVSLVFAVLHIGYQSILNLVFVFLVGLFFSLVVARTRSILGVSLAHGLTNIMLYLVLPVLLL